MLQKSTRRTHTHHYLLATRGRLSTCGTSRNSEWQLGIYTRKCIVSRWRHTRTDIFPHSRRHVFRPNCRLSCQCLVDVYGESNNTTNCLVSRFICVVIFPTPSWKKRHQTRYIMTLFFYMLTWSSGTIAVGHKVERVKLCILSGWPVEFICAVGSLDSAANTQNTSSRCTSALYTKLEDQAKPHAGERQRERES